VDWLNEAKKAGEEVLNVLGVGYDEKTYEEALAHELRLRNIPYERQRNFEMLYKGYKVGEGRADLILNPLWFGNGGNEIVLELKAVKKITEAHKRQAQVYMVSLNIDQGAVLSFAEPILLEVVPKPKKGFDRAVAQPSRSKKFLATILKQAARNVYDYFGVEFIYRERGLEIFPNAIAVELRLNGISFSTGSFPICYKHHKVDEFPFDFVFDRGVVANVLPYKNEDEIVENLDELKFYLRQFNLHRGYLICIPSKEGDRVLIKTV